eukprot:1182840-Prorocentrum_minimum.AAC.4
MSFVWQPAGSAVRLNTLPCGVWNALPAPASVNLGCGATTDTRLLHFKGALKKYEPEYWQEVYVGRPMGAVMKAISASRLVDGAPSPPRPPPLPRLNYTEWARAPSL